jgi:hypothetical protein
MDNFKDSSNSIISIEIVVEYPKYFDIYILTIADPNNINNPNEPYFHFIQIPEFSSSNTYYAITFLVFLIIQFEFNFYNHHFKWNYQITPLQHNYM